jgi:hypothetical protein
MCDSDRATDKTAIYKYATRLQLEHTQSHSRWKNDLRQLRWSGLRSLPNTLPQRKPIPYPRPVRLLSSSPPFTFQPCTHAPLPTLPSTKIPPDSHSLATTNADPLFRSQIPNNARNIYRTLMNYTSPISDLAGTTMLQRCRGNHRAFVVERKWGCSESADMGTDSWARVCERDRIQV